MIRRSTFLTAHLETLFIALDCTSVSIVVIASTKEHDPPIYYKCRFCKIYIRSAMALIMRYKSSCEYRESYKEYRDRFM